MTPRGYEPASRSATFCRACLLRTERMVPLRDRITIDSVSAPYAV